MASKTMTREEFVKILLVTLFGLAALAVLIGTLFGLFNWNIFQKYKFGKEITVGVAILGIGIAHCLFLLINTQKKKEKWDHKKFARPVVTSVLLLVTCGIYLCNSTSGKSGYKSDIAKQLEKNKEDSIAIAPDFNDLTIKAKEVEELVEMAKIADSGLYNNIATIKKSDTLRREIAINTGKFNTIASNINKGNKELAELFKKKNEALPPLEKIVVFEKKTESKTKEKERLAKNSGFPKMPDGQTDKSTSSGFPVMPG